MSRVGGLAAGARAIVCRARARAVTLALLLAVPADDIVTQIENAVIGFFSDIWAGISSFFGTIFNAIANTFATIFNAPAGAIEASFASLTTWSAQYGPLAPIITLLITAAVLLIATFLIWLIIRISVIQGGKTENEVEEGL